MTQELNCSDAAKMLIERMATHPEDFEPGERFWGVMKYLIEGDDIGGFHIMSKRDVEAIMAASQQLHENKLMEYVLRKLLVNDEDPQRDSRLGRASPQRGKITNMTHPSQMTLQGSSLVNPNPYQNMYPTGGSST